MKKKKLITGISFFMAMVALTVSVYAASFTFIYDFDSVLDSGTWRTMAKGSIAIELSTTKVYYQVNQGSETDVTNSYSGNDIYIDLYKKTWYGGSQFVSTYANFKYPGKDSKSKTFNTSGDYRMKLYKDRTSYNYYVVGNGTIKNP